MRKGGDTDCTPYCRVAKRDLTCELTGHEGLLTVAAIRQGLGTAPSLAGNAQSTLGRGGANARLLIVSGECKC